MTNKVTWAVAVVLMALLMIGAASADSMTIEPTSETITVPVGSDAFDSVGLSVVYTGMFTGSTYSVVIRKGDDDPAGAIFYAEPNGDGSLGALPVIPYYRQEVHWTPHDTETYTIYASGKNGPGKRKITAQAPIAPTPELSTTVLTSAGLIGLVGLVRLRRKD